MKDIDYIVSLLVIAALIYFGVMTFTWGMESLKSGRAYQQETVTVGAK